MDGSQSFWLDKWIQLREIKFIVALLKRITGCHIWYIFPYAIALFLSYNSSAALALRYVFSDELVGNGIHRKYARLILIVAEVVMHGNNVTDIRKKKLY